MVPKTLHRFNTDCLRLDNWITIAPKTWNLEKNSAVSNEHRGTRTQIKNDGRRWAQWVLEPRPSCQPMWALRKTNTMDRGEARSEKTLVPDFIIFTLDSKFPSKALINNTVIWFGPWCLCTTLNERGFAPDWAYMEYWMASRAVVAGKNASTATSLFSFFLSE